MVEKLFVYLAAKANPSKKKKRWVEMCTFLALKRFQAFEFGRGLQELGMKGNQGNTNRSLCRISCCAEWIPAESISRQVSFLNFQLNLGYAIPWNSVWGGVFFCIVHVLYRPMVPRGVRLFFLKTDGCSDACSCARNLLSKSQKYYSRSKLCKSLPVC